MKKIKLVGILEAVVLIGGSLSIPLINNHIAYKVEKALCEIPLPEKTELSEVRFVSSLPMKYMMDIVLYTNDTSQTKDVIL